MLAKRCSYETHEAWRQPWACCVLGHKKPFTKICDHTELGWKLCVCVQQRQSKPSVQHVWFWMPYLAQVSHNIWGIHTQGWCLEFAKWGLYPVLVQVSSEQNLRKTKQQGVTLCLSPSAMHYSFPCWQPRLKSWSTKVYCIMHWNESSKLVNWCKC